MVKMSNDNLYYLWSQTISKGVDDIFLEDSFAMLTVTEIVFNFLQFIEFFKKLFQDFSTHDIHNKNFIKLHFEKTYL